MLRLLVVIVVAVSVVGDENRWVWGTNNRNQRAFNNDPADKYGNTFYGREKDREPTTRRPSTGQPNEEDFINPDELRNYNGPSNFGYPPLGPSGPAPVNNFPPGFGAQPGVNSPQVYPNNGYPVPSGPGQPTYPTPASGFGGYPAPVGGGYLPAPNAGYPAQVAQGGYPNQGIPQGFPPTGPFPPTNTGFTGLAGYPGIGNIFGLGGFPGQNPATGQAPTPNLGGAPGYPGYPFTGYGGSPYPTQGAAYPNQAGFPAQPGVPSQYPTGSNYPQVGGQYPTGQYIGCGQFGPCPPAAGQLGQYPTGYPGSYPSPYPGQYPTGQYPTGQYPFPDPYAGAGFNPNPYGITPYNRGGGYASAFDDYDETNKNGTSGSTRALKPEGKFVNSSSSVPRSIDVNIHKNKKT